MTIFDVLANRQRTIEALFRRVHAAALPEHRPALAAFVGLSTRLIAVMRAERAVVYPAFVVDAGLDEEVGLARQQHDAIERSIHEIRLAGLTTEAWQGAVTQLHAMVTEHHELEELMLVPMARLRISPEHARKLAADFVVSELLAMTVAGVSITYELPAPRRARAPRRAIPARAPER